MTSNDIKTIQLIVNSEQATKRLDDLKTKLTDIKRKKDEAFEKGDATAFDLYSKELRKTQKEISKVATPAATEATLKSSTPPTATSTTWGSSANVARGSRVAGISARRFSRNTWPP